MNPLREAAKRLPGHWIKGAAEDEEGNFCSLGMIYDVVNHDSTLYSKIAEIVEQVAYEEHFDRMDYKSLIHFNDHPDTTINEVVAVFEKAAVRWDEQYG